VRQGCYTETRIRLPISAAQGKATVRLLSSFRPIKTFIKLEIDTTGSHAGLKLRPTSIRFSCDSTLMTLQKLANYHPALRGGQFSGISPTFAATFIDNRRETIPPTNSEAHELRRRIRERESPGWS
jgi:hypothetical protein